MVSSQIKQEWKTFAPKMECTLFHTTAILNDTTLVNTLIDNGSQSYAIINERLAKRLNLPLIDTNPRQITGVLEGATREIKQATYFSLDIGGFKTHRAFAYVLQGQSEDLIIGRPWMKQNEATIDEKRAEITFDGYDTKVLSNEHLQKEPSQTTTLQVSQVMASTYAGIAQRNRKQKTDLQLFSASLADCDGRAQL